MFATTAPPFPKPASAIAAIPTQTFGATAAQPVPTAKIDDEADVRGRDVALDQRRGGEPADDEPDPRSGPEQAEAEVAGAGTTRLARNTSATFTIPLATITIDQTTSTHNSARECAHDREALREVAPLAAADRALALEQPRPG